MDQSNYSIVAVGVLDQCRTFIRKSLRQIEGMNVSKAKNESTSVKLATILLDFMLEANRMFSSSLTKGDLDVLFSWCQNLASIKTNCKIII